MGQYKRKDFAHYMNTANSSNNPTWKLEGVGVEALSLSYNPQIDTFKTIIDVVSNNEFNGYQIQSSVSGKRIESTDAIWEWLNTARKTASSIESEMLEIDMKSLSSGSYTALKYDILVVINEFLGENATISYDLYVKGTPVQGTVTMSNGEPTFTVNVSL